MRGRLMALARVFWPMLGTTDQETQVAATIDILSFLYTSPLALGGLIWLALVTDTEVFFQQWPLLLLFLCLILLFRRVPFFLIVRLGPDLYANYGGALDEVILWTGVLLCGPALLWLHVLHLVVSLVYRWLRARSTAQRWNLARNASMALVMGTLTILAALAVYRASGGTVPLRGLAWGDVLPALGATMVQVLLSRMVPLPMVLGAGCIISGLGTGPRARRDAFSLSALSLVVGLVLLPFAILVAGLYVEVGWGAFLFLVAGMFLAALLAHQLSRAAESDRQRSQELQQLELLGRAIIAAPPDGSALPALLRQHIPEMIPLHQSEIRLFPDRLLLRFPQDRPVVPDAAWEWLRQRAEGRAFLPGMELPWGGRQPAGETLLLAPIIEAGRREPRGGICIEPGLLPGQDLRAVRERLPVMHALAGQIAAALGQAEAYARTLTQEKMQRELALAWEIQASLLPVELPAAPGWQFTATLQPAQQTSGDFYDWMLLPDGRWAVVIADVAGKGMSAALYMALSRTLIRTHAMQRHPLPGRVLRAVNQRLLSDSRAELFVTVFFGLLDPTSGMLTYANAGHFPPYLLRAGDDRPPTMLTATGIPLGAMEEMIWQDQSIRLEAGDLLVLYTDGVTEAEDGQGILFGKERLLEVIQGNREAGVQALESALLAALHRFRGDAPQADDITLLLIRRETGGTADLEA